MKRYSLLAALLLSVVLIACNNNDDPGPDTPDPTPENFLYWTDFDNALVLRMPTTGGTIDTLYTSTDGINGSIVIVLDPNSSDLYAFGYNSDNIFRGSRDGSVALTELFNQSDGVNGPLGAHLLGDRLFVNGRSMGLYAFNVTNSSIDTFNTGTNYGDWGITEVEGNIYFVSGDNNLILTEAADGSGSAVALDSSMQDSVDFLLDLEYIPGKDVFLVADNGEGIWRVQRNGSFDRFFNAPGLSVASIAYDPETDLVYFGTDSGTDYLYSMPYNSPGDTTRITSTPTDFVYDIEVY